MRVLQGMSPAGAAIVAERLFFSPPAAKLSPEGRRFMATGRRYALEVDGRRVVGWSWGEGRPVYLVHGWGSSASRWQAMVPALVARGTRVVVFDGPGHGHSGRGMTSMPEFARALAAVTAAHGPAQAIVAHSLGAAATAFALTQGVTAERVVLLAPPANVADWAVPFAGALGIRPEVMQRVRERSQRRIRFNWDDLHIPTHARTMATPALIIHDRDDETVRWEDGAAIARAWPGASLVETRGLGHRGLLRDPDVLRRVVGFLGSGER